MGFGELEASDALGRDQSIELTVEGLLHQRATRALSRYAATGTCGRRPKRQLRGAANTPPAYAN
jgi:hypothetical protein